MCAVGSELNVRHRCLHNSFPIALTAQMLTFLEPIQFIEVELVCKAWQKASLSSQALHQQMQVCSALLNRVIAIELAMSALSNRLL